VSKFTGFFGYLLGKEAEYKSYSKAVGQALGREGSQG